MKPDKHNSRPVKECKTERQKIFEIQNRIFDDFQIKISKMDLDELKVYAKMNNIKL